MIPPAQVSHQQAAATEPVPAGKMTGCDAVSFAATYRPLLGLWVVSGSRAAVRWLPRVAAELAALADALCRGGRLHPLLGNTLVRSSGLWETWCMPGIRAITPQLCTAQPG